MWNLGERGCVRGVDHLEISLFSRHLLCFFVSFLCFQIGVGFGLCSNSIFD